MACVTCGEPGYEWLCRVCEVRHRNRLKRAIPLVLERDRGVCASCGVDTLFLQSMMLATFSGDWSDDDRGRFERLLIGRVDWLGRILKPWDADHVTPIRDGGSEDLNNLRTLCVPCHKAETAAFARTRSLRRRSAKDGR